MADTSIGTARIDVEVNADTAEATVKRLARGVEDFSKSAQQQYNQLGAAEKRRADSLIKQAETLGLTRAEQIAYNAQLKLSGPLLDEVNRKLAQNAARAQVAGAGLATTGKSAKEMAFAMRGLPAQITDIFTSLASGQRPTMVLLQQGGQLKDMFGGIGPAARALGSSLMGLVNPITLAGAAVGALFLAWKQGSQEATDFNAALIKTGNYAGITAREAQNLAEEMDNLAGVTQGSAMAALTAFASTGHFTGEALQEAAGAAAAWSEATGAAVEDTLAEFEKIRKDPVKALLELEATYHFLTKAQFDHIQQLKEEGREAEASAQATKIYSDVLRERSQQIIGNLGTLESSWRGLKNTAREAWDELLAVGREDTIANRILQAALLASPVGSTVSRLQASGRAGQATSDGLVAAAMAENDRTLNAVDVEAEREYLTFKDKYLTKEESKKKAIAELDRLALKVHLDDAEVAKLRAGIEERFKKAKSSNASKGIEKSTSAAAIQAIKDQQKVEQGAIQNSTQLLQANYAARLITVQEFYSEQKKLAQANTDAEEKSLLGQIDVLKNRNLTGKDSIDTQRKLAETEAELAKIRADGATKVAILAIQESDALKQRVLAAQAYKAALDQSEAALSAQFGSMVARISMGEREFAIQSQINELYRDQAKELLELARQRDAGQLDQATYEERAEMLNAAINREVEIVRDGYARMAQAQADWKNGAIAAYQDYLAATDNTAALAYDALGGMFTSLEDRVAGFFETGKFSFKGFLDDINAELGRFFAKQLVNDFIRMIAGGGGSNGDSTGWLASLFGGTGSSQGSVADLFASDSFGYFDTGGYTGPGPKKQVAGFVHAGEYVINAASTRALGRSVLDQLNMGNVPVVSGGGGNYHFTVNGSIDPRSAEQIARETSQKQRMSVARA